VVINPPDGTTIHTRGLSPPQAGETHYNIAALARDNQIFITKETVFCMQPSPINSIHYTCLHSDRIGNKNNPLVI